MRSIKNNKGAKGFIGGFIIAGAMGLFLYAKPADPYFEISKNMEIFATLFKELNAYYVDPIEPGKLVKTGIDAMLENLDPYTNYITEAEVEEYEFQTTGKYGGIGASMRKKGEDIYIGDVYENSPSQKAGLHPGDLIIDIDGHPLKGKSIDDISVLLKGTPGTQLNMKVKDNYTGVTTQKMITRGEISLSSVPYAGLTGPHNDIAYVKLTQFTEGCARQVGEALDSLKKAQPKLNGVILDLRNNPGGLLNEAIQVCNLFIDRGQLVVSTKGKQPEMDKQYKTIGSSWDMNVPLAIMVNHSSASASEIVAGTIQDLDRGIIIGERSYGKGLVQNVRRLGYNSSLKLTTARYYTPSGRCIQAIDYTHRNADGSAAHIPDSLKKPFKTNNGRTVLSGGGIEPDINVKEEPISRLAITLYTKNYFFDYATDYVHKHPTIAPALQFSLTDAEYMQFTHWLENKDYSYETETEDAFDSLKAIAIREKYYDAAKSEFTMMQAKLSHDKKLDLDKHKTEIKQVLESEIASRYYYLRGRIAQSFAADKELARSLEILGQPEKYKVYLERKK
ncbi:MAG: S41 family peptidase [Taibaiella sp.]|nr:S41 family peptidase [Taibaiella sp.]